MIIIKLNAIDSTNTFLKQLARTEIVENYTCVVADIQTNGRGQMGSSWQSESSKNLTFSVFKTFELLHIKQHFLLSIVSSLAVVTTLKKYNLPKLHIKWPNDILAGNKKICGILIENSSLKNTITSSVIGIGINVNQTIFNDLPKASSMALITGQTFVLDEVLSVFMEQLQHYCKHLEQKHYKILTKEYHSYLFRKDIPSMFKDISNNIFPAVIRKVTNTGQLVLELENNVIKSYDLKHIELLY